MAAPTEQGAKDSVLVRGAPPQHFTLFRVVMIAVTVICLVIGFTTGLFGWLIAAGVIGTVAVAIEIYAFLLNRSRQWVDDTDDGFTLYGVNDERDYLDEDVTSLAYGSKVVLANGTPTGVTRMFRLWMANETKPIDMRTFVAVGTTDPLQPLIDRLINKHVANGQAELKKGGQIVGQDWQLDQKTFHHKQGSVAVSELSACGVYEDRVCLWQTNEDNAFCRIPVDSQNAIVLLRIVAKLLEGRPESQPEGDRDGLGRVLFERKAGYLIEILLGLLTAVLFGGGLATWRETPAVMIISVIAGLLTAGLVCFRTRSFRCQQRGVCLKTAVGENALRYAEIESFTYAATRHFHNGAYTGTSIALKFRPTVESEAKAVNYSTMVKGSDADLDELRDFISGVIASRLKQQILNGSSIHWVAKSKFTPRGLSYTPTSFFGKKEAEFMPYADFHGHSFKDGTLYIFRKKGQNAILSAPTNSDNFFPGFYLLLNLVANANSTAESNAEPLVPLEE